MQQMNFNSLGGEPEHGLCRPQNMLPNRHHEDQPHLQWREAQQTGKRWGIKGVPSSFILPMSVAQWHKELVMISNCFSLPAWVQVRVSKCSTKVGIKHAFEEARWFVTSRSGALGNLLYQVAARM